MALTTTKYTFDTENHPESNLNLDGVGVPIRAKSTTKKKQKPPKCVIGLSISIVLLVIVIIVLATFLIKNLAKNKLKEMADSHNTEMTLIQSRMNPGERGDVEKNREILKTSEIISNTISNNEELCTGKDCIFAASQLLQHMDETIDPCHNFYKFACGGYMKKSNGTVLSHDNAIPFMELSDLVADQLNHILSQPISIEEPIPYKLPKGLYQSCMKESLSAADMQSIVTNVVKQLGGWPLLEGRNWTALSWEKILNNFHTYGFPNDQLFKLSVGRSGPNATYYSLMIQPPTFSKPPEILARGFNNTEVFNYFVEQIQLVKLIGGPNIWEGYLDELIEAISFEASLARSVLNSRGIFGTSVSLYNQTTIRGLNKEYPFIPWIDYITSHSTLPISLSSPITVVYPEYFRTLNMLLLFSNDRSTANYLMLKVANTALDTLAILSPHGEKVQPKWKSCVEAVSKNFADAIAPMYLKEYFKENTRSDIRRLLEDIREAFLMSLKNNSWIDDLTREQIKDQFTSMETHVGYIDQLYNETELVEYYKQMREFDTDSSLFLENVLSLSKFRANKKWLKLGKNIGKYDFWKITSPTDINGYHIRGTNAIFFPAAILQGYFYNPKRPSFMNYGTLGWIGGHEMTHTVEVMKKQHNANIEGPTPPAVNPQFYVQPSAKADPWIEQVLCFVEQYRNYTFEGGDFDEGLDLLLGVLKSKENVADNAGIKAAYNAYQLWSQRNNGVDKKLPGLSSYTFNQLFWLSAANVYCGRTSSGLTGKRVLSDDHPPNEFRVNGVFANMPKFHDDFMCPISSPMNPLVKCDMW